jgi:hypothetical protein
VYACETTWHDNSEDPSLETSNCLWSCSQLCEKWKWSVTTELVWIAFMHIFFGLIVLRGRIPVVIIYRLPPYCSHRSLSLSSFNLLSELFSDTAVTWWLMWSRWWNDDWEEKLEYYSSLLIPISATRSVVMSVHISDCITYRWIIQVIVLDWVKCLGHWCSSSGCILGRGFIDWCVNGILASTPMGSVFNCLYPFAMKRFYLNKPLWLLPCWYPTRLIFYYLSEECWKLHT